MFAVAGGHAPAEAVVEALAGGHALLEAGVEAAGGALLAAAAVVPAPLFQTDCHVCIPPAGGIGGKGGGRSGSQDVVGASAGADAAAAGEGASAAGGSAPVGVCSSSPPVLPSPG